MVSSLQKAMIPFVDIILSIPLPKQTCLKLVRFIQFITITDYLHDNRPSHADLLIIHNLNWTFINIKQAFCFCCNQCFTTDNLFPSFFAVYNKCHATTVLIPLPLIHWAMGVLFFLHEWPWQILHFSSTTCQGFTEEGQGSTMPWVVNHWGVTGISHLHHLELLRQAQGKDGNLGH